jgi:hypothetical protein
VRLRHANARRVRTIIRVQRAECTLASTMDPALRLLSIYRVFCSMLRCERTAALCAGTEQRHLLLDVGRSCS